MNFQAFTLSKNPEWACIQVKAPESENRVPVHLVCVIDTSASMESHNKLENVKKSLQFLLDFLGSQDMISVITFSEKAKTILSQINDKDDIRSRISFIRIESNTNLSAGIIEANSSLQLGTNYKQGILLLTDGLANMGVTNSDGILTIVQSTITTFNTSISCIGYGTDHNVELLQNISSTGGGSYYVVNNLEDVATVFGDILGGLVSCVAQQVKVVLPIGTEVKSRYATNKVGCMEIIIGDIPAGMEAAFLAKIPVQFPVELKGYDIKNNVPFVIYSNVIATDDATLQLNGEAHYLRFEVVRLLDESHTLLVQYPIPDFTNQIEKIDACIKTITDYTVSHSLWGMLLEELHTCKKSLQSRDGNYDTPQIMRQHAGYIGTMRGLRATSDNTNYRQMEVESTFSNNIQRQFSNQLTATVSESQANEEKYSTDTQHEMIPLTRQNADSRAYNPENPDLDKNVSWFSNIIGW